MASGWRGGETDKCVVPGFYTVTRKGENRAKFSEVFLVNWLLFEINGCITVTAEEGRMYMGTLA